MNIKTKINFLVHVMLMSSTLDWVAAMPDPSSRNDEENKPQVSDYQPVSELFSTVVRHHAGQTQHADVIRRMVKLYTCTHICR